MEQNQMLVSFRDIFIQLGDKGLREEHCKMFLKLVMEEFIQTNVSRDNGSPATNFLLLGGYDKTLAIGLHVDASTAVIELLGDFLPGLTFAELRHVNCEYATPTDMIIRW